MTHEFSTALLLAFLLFVGLFAGHFFRWNVIPKLIDRNGDPHTIVRYIYGVLWIGLGFSLWVSLNSDRAALADSLIIFWIMACAAGAGTVAGYGVDWIIERRVSRQTGAKHGTHDQR